MRPRRSLILLLALAGAPFAATAGLSDALDGMFMSTATNPQVYQSQSRRGFVGGALALRTPVKSTNLIFFDPPRISAGCGGIDMFMGSFSFISAEEFKNLLRNIGSAAAGYAFKLAIKHMCPSCASVLDTLQSLATALNSSAMNSCRVAQMMLDPVADALKKQDAKAQGEGEMIQTNKGANQDLFDAIKQTFTKPDGAKEATQAENVYGGNLVWRALWRSKSANVVGSPTAGIGATLDRQTAEYIMSVTGTSILPTKPDEFGNNECPAGASKCENGAALFNPLLSFRDLIDGSEDKGKKFWSCLGPTDSEMGCQNMREAPLNWKGTRAYVHKVLFGVEALDDYSPRPGSLVEKVVSISPLTGEQQAFISMMTVPILKLLLEVQKEPSAVVQTAQMAEGIMAHDYATALAAAMIQSMALAFSGQNKVAMPANWMNRMEELRKEHGQMIAERETHTEQLVRIGQIVRMMVESGKGMYYGSER